MSRTSGVTRQAAATTGPASVAMPTSSTPPTRVSPCSQRFFSKRRLGTPRLVGPINSRRVRGPLGRATRRGASGRSAPLFAKRGGLPDALAEEVESCPAGVAVTHDLDLLETRRVDEERALDADAARDPTDGDLLIESSAADPEDGALVVLEPFAVAFDHAHGQAHGVPGPDLGEVGLELVGGKRLQDVVHRHNDCAHGVSEW